jgi:membrane-bound ClpP family serine protease
MTLLLIIGSVGVAIVLLSLLLGDVLEGVFDAIDVDAGSGLFSTPVIGAFLGALGFGGALILSATDGAMPVALAGGLASGVALAAVALWLTRVLMRMGTDAPVRLDGLVGKPADVVSAIPAGGLGEVLVSFAGQRMKLNARCAHAVTTGERVVVIAVSSSSSVVVEREAEFWGEPRPLSEGETPNE